MVVFLDGFNDYYAYEKDFDQFRDYAYQERAHTFLAAPTVAAWLYYSGWWLFRKSHLFYLTSKAIYPVWQRLHRTGSPGRNRINLDQALANLRVNAENNFFRIVQRKALILKHEGVVPVFALQPELVFTQRKVLTEMERKIYGEMANHWQENYVEFKNRARPIVRDYMERAARNEDFAFFDLTDVFSGMAEDAYTDYTHLTPMGNRRLAEVLGARILPLIRQTL